MMQSRAMPVKPGRIEEIGYLRGFGVLAVIAIHTTGYFTEISEFNYLVLANLWIDVFSQFAVPLFILISGFVLARNYPEDYSLKKFYIKRVRSIIPQYLIFSILYTAFNNWAVMQNSSFGTNVSLLLKNVWNAEASYHLWFFAIIIQFYLLFPVIMKLYNLFKQSGRAELLVVLFLIVQTLFMVGIHTFYLSGIKLNFIGFLFYFVLGVYTADHFAPLKRGLKGQTLFLFTMSLILTIGSSFFIIIGLTTGYRFSSIPAYFLIGSELVYPVFRVITFLFLFNMAQNLIKKRKTLLAKMINRFGEYSFGIYLIHIFFNQSAIKMLRNRQIGFDDWIFYPIVLGVTLILSYLSVRLISFFPFSYYLLGSQTNKRTAK
ncbi:acyltransferase [Desulfosporosinus youngiae]|uniref:Putative acyltransferase n=1 Tax=Desulfosporosinus youngiae DSM 17734 TaxID=768710 RepID=H5XZP1_9FIRM|nr:acyltransferase [Desulfosporosinus youngiae]EHQ92015.1 putative acyltransferase [Desulfosporosinus youngiae DSM 17734]